MSREVPAALKLRDYVPPIDRAALVMAVLWLIIVCIGAYDVYLSIKYQDTLRFQELNPLGRWLMDADGGSVAAFMGVKFLGSMIALGAVQLLYFYRRRIGLAVASGLAALQGMLALYLCFG